MNNNNIQYDKWVTFIDENVYGAKTRSALKKYVEILINKNVPIILNEQHFAKLIGIKSGVISKIVYSSSKFYYHYEIPKRRGGNRKISSPYPVLLEIQKWIYKNILLKENIDSCVTGFIKEKSIIDNAKPHLNSAEILQMDITDFFPSISKKRIIALLKYYGYTHHVAYFLASLCCLNNALPQGAPTSPMLSNIVSKRMDKRLGAFSNKLGLIYTRYADDMCFSGRDISPNIINYISEIVISEGFAINKSKTKIVKGKRKKIITGISISSGKMTIPKLMKREIRKNVHYILTNGLFEHLKQNKINDPIYLERLLGKLHFWGNIEPESKYVNSAIDRLKKYREEILI